MQRGNDVYPCSIPPVVCHFFSETSLKHYAAWPPLSGCQAAWHLACLRSDGYNTGEIEKGTFQGQCARFCTVTTDAQSSRSLDGIETFGML